MSRTIKVAKLGEQYKNINVEGAVTYKVLIQMAGFSGTESVMADGYGAVILDEPVPDNVTAVVVSMPKFAGGALPAGLRVVDENGVEWKPVSSETPRAAEEPQVNNLVLIVEDSDDWDLEDDDDDYINEDDEDINSEEFSEPTTAPVRSIKVAQLGSPYKIVEITGSATYRSVIQMAGFVSADGVFAEGLGAVILDEPVAETVTSIVISMPKFAGGLHL